MVAGLTAARSWSFWPASPGSNQSDTCGPDWPRSLARAAQHSRPTEQAAEPTGSAAGGEEPLSFPGSRGAGDPCARDAGYRHEVWDRLKQALALETPDKDPAERRGRGGLPGGLCRPGPTAWAVFTSNIRAVAIDPDGGRVVFGLPDGTMLLRDLATGAEWAQSHEHRSPSSSLSLAAAGGRMASADVDGMVMIGELIRRRWLGTVPETMAYSSGRASPNDGREFCLPGRRLAAPTPDGEWL